MTNDSNKKPSRTPWKPGQAAAIIATVALFAALLVFAVYEGTKHTITFTANGSTEEFRTHAKTVGDFLKEQEVAVSEHDDLSLAADTPIEEDKAIEWDAAEQYTITVDGKETTAWTTSSKVEEILAKAEIAVTEHDKIVPALQEEASVDSPIAVEKAYEVTLQDGKEKKTVWTTSTTVADFLKANDVTLNKMDRVEQKPDEKVKPGSKVQVVRVEKVTDVVEDPAKFAVEKKKDASLLKGKEKVVQKGENGVVKKTYEVVKENGKEVKRELKSEKIVKQPKKQVVAVGTKTMVASVSRGASSGSAAKAAEPKKAAAEAPAAKSQSVKTASAEAAPSGGREFYVSATAYTADCAGCSGITATGINLKANPGAKVIAVDPGVIPLGSKVWVEGYGYAVAGDTGGAIKGNKIDLFVPDRSQALAFGRKQVKIKVLN